LAHDYFGIDDDILWDLIRNKVSDLVKAVEAYLKCPEQNLTLQ